jgi:hypothetical protein
MEAIIRKIEIRIETNEECIDNFNAPDHVNDLLRGENEFLKGLIEELKKQ